MRKRSEFIRWGQDKNVGIGHCRPIFQRPGKNIQQLIGICWFSAVCFCIYSCCGQLRVLSSRLSCVFTLPLASVVHYCSLASQGLRCNCDVCHRSCLHLGIMVNDAILKDRYDQSSKISVWESDEINCDKPLEIAHHELGQIRWSRFCILLNHHDPGLDSDYFRQRTGGRPAATFGWKAVIGWFELSRTLDALYLCPAYLFLCQSQN